jgi:plastocyanin
MDDVRVSRASLVVLAFALGGCGSSGGASPSAMPQPAPPTVQPATVSITKFGLIPFETSVDVGGRVTFVNSDDLPHDIQGGPDPEHHDCPEIDIVGFLTPGQRRQTEAFTAARTCEYHDHSDPDVHHGFVGRIVIR